MVKENWIGKPLGKMKPYNFFKTNPKDIPSNMFKDYDRDGVANVFDCKPHNKKEQGLISAVVGAVGGLFKGTGVKKGWQEGMAKPSVIAKYRQKRAMKREAEEYTPERAKGLQIAMAMAKRREDYSAKKEKFEKEQAYKNRGVIRKFTESVQQKIAMAHPRYLQIQKEKYYESRINDPKLSEQKRRRAEYLLAKTQQDQKTKREKFGARLSESVFPIESMTSYGSGDMKTIQGIPGRGRGRPRGSLDVRYAKYGGVFGYRRYLSQQRRAFRTQLQLQKEQMRLQRQMQTLPQYEQMQDQAIQEQQVQGQAMQIPTQIYEQVQAQMPQPPQAPPQPFQYVTEEQKRPIGRVFKSYGGSPYQPVNNQPLASPRATIPYGYVESVDMMTGRRYMKPLPKTERWAGGNNAA